MNRTPLFLALLAACAVPARAGISVGASETLGSDNYRGTKADASVDVNDNVYVEPSWSMYRSDSSSGTFNRFGARLGYEQGPLDLGINGGLQPKVNGYRQTNIGADLTLTLSPGGTKHGHKMAGPASEGGETFGAGLAKVDLGGSINRIEHYDDYSASGMSGMGLGRAGARRATVFRLGQTDLTAFAGLKFLITELSGSVTKSVYDKDLSGSNARLAQFLSLSGVESVVQGFPDTSTNLKLKWKTLPLVRPYLSYTRTTFKLGESPSNAVELGGTVGLEMVDVKASYERYTQSGFPDANYFTLGASVNF